ncbi:LacI family DNA-binding transcriptional regulator [Sphingomonas sp. HITSZ_GF]|uniref:LacI family DNA-binding transcriptional regulator n=1 Tax=Sphingomonas sp. HITSZ_GF TaxID=3037247 RepID=UPI00240E6A63|nr:LacI family DNA-binding transcriptional regulator [Sphingomonas sp. HITSZ_GF]MDG2533472.1 LacI family DNA-binding transcriptional regulator [Sphingomonas sp. HITSZ_GF]
MTNGLDEEDGMARRRGSSGVTIQAVAERAGTSTMTVSNFLNGTGKMGDATRERVREAVDALGYKPNAAARALASSGAARIGLVYANPQNAFLSAMLVGTLHAAAARGAQLMVQHGGDLEYEALAEALRALVRSGANALLLPPPYSELVAGQPILAELGVPIAAVAAGRPIPGIFTVRVDDRAAAQAMTDLLIRQGHRRIGFIGGPEGHGSTAGRLAGYRDSLLAHQLPEAPELIEAGDFLFESGLDAAKRLLDLAEPPSAIFAANDDMAAAVISVAHRRGLAIPNALAVAGFDDTPIAVKTWPALTTVRQPIAEMAERATSALIERIANPESDAGAADMCVGFKLVERASTDIGRLRR